jgi:hypothetical protein
MRGEMKKLLGRGKEGVARWVDMNGINVKWPWVDEVPELSIVIPEVAVSLLTLHLKFLH